LQEMRAGAAVGEGDEMSAKEKLILFLMKTIPDNAEFSGFSLTINDDGSMFISIEKEETEE